MSVYNQFPIQVSDLALGSALQGQLDQNGLQVVGSNAGTPAPVTATLGTVGSGGGANTELQIVEAVSAGNSFTSMVSSRAMSLSKLVSSVSSSIFSAGVNALSWRSANGNSITLTEDESSQIVFSQADMLIMASGQDILASDGMNTTLGSSGLATVLDGSGVSVAVPLTVSSTLLDGMASAGSSGYLLSSTSTGIEWIAPPSGTGAVNSVDINAIAETPITSGVALQLPSDATLPAGRYIVQCAFQVTFAPLAGAGLQESFIACAVSPDGTTYQAVSADQTVRNIVGGSSQTYYVQSSAIVTIAEAGNTFGVLNVTWSGGAGASVSASGQINSTLVNV
jgi:hypothetical protein